MQYNADGVSMEEERNNHGRFNMVYGRFVTKDPFWDLLL